MIDSTRGRSAARHALVAALLFQGLSGIAGGIGLIADPTGVAVGLPAEWLEGSPFPDYLVPGLVLLVVLGLAPLAAAWGTWTDRGWGPAASLTIGTALLVWLAVEIAIIGYQPDPPLQAIYGVVGLAVTGLGLREMRTS